MSRPPDRSRPVRVANCSGFYGDRLSAAREMLDGGPIDVLTGDWLAELTMLLLARVRAKDGAGYAATFLAQLRDVLGDCLDRGIRVVANAGGLDPVGCADAVAALAAELGLAPRVGVVTGDDLAGRLDVLGDARNLDTGETLAEVGLRPLTANAYLGGFGIAAALAAGADVVVTGRVTDASLVVGPAAWWHGWSPTDLDALAGATVAGHVVECGTQATGGNYAFFTEVPEPEHLGFPLVEVAADGSSVVTKHPGTGGLVDVGTVTAQLLYEIGGPRYLGPDVVARFDTVAVEQVGPDRVRLSGTVGEPPPRTAKVSVSALGGFRNAMTLVVTGLEQQAKADLVRRQLEPLLVGVRQADVALVPAGRDRAELRISVRDPDRRRVGRAFSSAVVELALASYPGLYAMQPPGDATPYGVHWPCAMPAAALTQTVTVDGAVVATVPALSPAAGPKDAAEPAAELPVGEEGDGQHHEPTVRAPLGLLAGARSGDKGGDANVGLWVREPAAAGWLRRTVTADWVRSVVPDAARCAVDVHPLPNLHAVNVVLHGLLGRGVAENVREDPQAKALGEWLRAQPVDVPAALLSKEQR